MNSFQFQHRDLILLFAGIPFLVLLFVLLIQWKKKVRKRMGDERLVKLLVANFSTGRFTSKFILVSVALALGAVAAMNPRRPGSASNVTRKGIDVVIAMDVSKSMLATDLEPNRLERAKQFINKLMEALPNDRIGLIVFAGKAYLQMPLTSDHGAARLFVNAAGTESVPQQGTVISDALNMSVNAYNRNEGRFKAVVLISDGEDHDEEAVNTAGDLADQGVMINTVGVGSAEGSTLIDPSTGELKKDENGSTVMSKLNEEILKEIAEKTNGVYTRLQASDEAVTIIKDQLSQIETKAYNDISLMNYKTYFMWFAGGMLLLLVIESLLPERKKKLPV